MLKNNRQVLRFSIFRDDDCHKFISSFYADNFDIFY